MLYDAHPILDFEVGADAAIYDTVAFPERVASHIPGDLNAFLRSSNMTDIPKTFTVGANGGTITLDFSNEGKNVYSTEVFSQRNERDKRDFQGINAEYGNRLILRKMDSDWKCTINNLQGRWQLSYHFEKSR